MMALRARLRPGIFAVRNLKRWRSEVASARESVDYYMQPLYAFQPHHNHYLQQAKNRLDATEKQLAQAEIDVAAVDPNDVALQHLDEIAVLQTEIDRQTDLFARRIALRVEDAFYDSKAAALAVAALIPEEMLYRGLYLRGLVEQRINGLASEEYEALYKRARKIRNR